MVIAILGDLTRLKEDGEKERTKTQNSPSDFAYGRKIQVKPQQTPLRIIRLKVNFAKGVALLTDLTQL